MLLALNNKIANLANNEKDITLLDLKAFTEEMGSIGEQSAKAFEIAFRDLGIYSQDKANKLMSEGIYE